MRTSRIKVKRKPSTSKPDREDHPISIRIDNAAKLAVTRDLVDLNVAVERAGGKRMSLGAYAKQAVLTHGRHRAIVDKLSAMLDALRMPGTNPQLLEIATEIEAILGPR